MTTMTAELPPSLEQTLEIGETIRWHGRPLGGRHIDGMVVQLAIVLGMSVVITAVFLMVFFTHETFADLSLTYQLVITGCVLAFEALGVTVVFRMLMRRAREAGRAVYAVTNRRILILEPGRITVIDPAKMPKLRCITGPDGSGDIYFGCPDDEGRCEESLEPEARFFHIAEVERVYALIESLRDA